VTEVSGSSRLSSLPSKLDLRVERDGSFSDLGLLSHAQAGQLVYVRDASALEGAPVLAAFCVLSPIELVSKIGATAGLATAADAERAFYRVHEYLARETDFYWRDFASEIDPSARIHPRAFVAERGVRVGPRVVIEANATVLERVSIGADTIVRAGAVLGGEGFEFKARAVHQHRWGKEAETIDGVQAITHAGSVVVGARVEIQANTVVDRALFRRPTRIGNESKIDNLVHIAHSVEIGERCLIVAGAIIAGSASIGDDVWIGPGAVVSSGVRVGDRASVVLGTRVVRDVAADSRVSGDLRVFPT